ncbi:ABC transporter ATP-binding protein [Alteromonas sediminis]|uniref:ABC transporter ATP-binding protein n=1 Tax=Alteromonas sediminis TaxID=2259342 RepID=A0A3N5Z8B8_9ALTE|nr:ABC transporter ATP-binding protein [Alteromonas sediminis]RPJ67054.1 ABC transporter ATP-binding protein [Alteromonas sediminis]
MQKNHYIQLDGVNKSFSKGRESVDILKSFNLSINQGEFVAIMGPSGLGKSTLLHLIGGLDEPCDGTIKIGDVTLSGLSESERTKWRAHHVGFVFQAHHLIPVLTAQKNVELPLILTKLSAKDRQKHGLAALELVDMKERCKHYPSELSGGQEQRVAIARAIVSDPNLLLCDEPTGNLDRKTADDILRLLAELNQQFNKTVIMVTHDPKAAEYATRVIQLEQYLSQNSDNRMADSGYN